MIIDLDNPDSINSAVIRDGAVNGFCLGGNRVASAVYYRKFGVLNVIHRDGSGFLTVSEIEMGSITDNTLLTSVVLAVVKERFG